MRTTYLGPSVLGLLCLLGCADSGPPTAEVSGTLPRLDLETAVGGYEKDLILDALKTSRGNRAKAARLLGTTERIIAYKVKKYEIDCARFKAEPRPRAAVADPA